MKRLVTLASFMLAIGAVTSCSVSSGDPFGRSQELHLLLRQIEDSVADSGVSPYGERACLSDASRYNEIAAHFTEEALLLWDLPLRVGAVCN